MTYWRMQTVPIGRGSLILVNHKYGKTVYLRFNKEKKWQGQRLIGLVEDRTQATRFTHHTIGAGIARAASVVNRAFIIERLK
jgi:hypothetical protein